MKKVILVDGNNILFRSYFATAYKGNILRNSKGFPTNALYGFMNMINKIIKDMEPNYMMIAFDKGKTFRHEKYKDYKGGRSETPNDLKLQFPVAKKLCEAMGIKYFEIDNYEADDIIGTFAKEIDEHPDFIGTIVSSDKDLLQLISDDVDVKLLKSNDYIMMNKETFKETYGIEPIRIIDLKALMGDSSDNIPGVKGIGEKTALSLLQKYESLDGVYEHIEEVTKNNRERLKNDKENAYFSYELATIYKEVPIDVNLDNIKYVGPSANYNEILEEYEFYSFLKKREEVKIDSKINYDIITNLDNLEIKDDYAIYIETKGSYHDRDIKGIAIYNIDVSAFIPYEHLKNWSGFTNNFKKYTYDLKKLIVSFRYLNIDIDSKMDDLMILSYLLNYNAKEDLSYLMNSDNIGILFSDQLYKEKDITLESIAEHAVKKAKYIYENRNRFKDEVKDKGFLNLYEQIEMPTCYVLADMEYTGVYTSLDVLYELKDEIKIKMDLLSNEIYNLAGEEFNILSPKQLGKILFEKLAIPYPKRIKNDSYSTSSDILEKLKDYTIINKILDYRMFAKLYSNYAVGLTSCIKDDGKIHTTFNQTLTRTGRLSSTNPNLQNIPVREEYGRLFRKAFMPSKDSVLISADYSQIELRVFAHMSNAENLVEAFNKDMDIHTKTAMDVFHVPEEGVTSKMRRDAKAVNFGILYGISSFGLSEDLNINVGEAKAFINHYLETFPGIKNFMDDIIKNAYNDGYVKTLFGRIRYIDELNNSNYIIRSSGERIALNTPVQGTAADILKKAMIEIYNEFNKRNLKAKMIIQVHDELLFDCPIEEQEEVLGIVKDIMENTYKLNVPLKVDINVGKNWYEAK